MQKDTVLGVWSLPADVIHFCSFQGDRSALKSPLRRQKALALGLCFPWPVCGEHSRPQGTFPALDAKYLFNDYQEEH